MSSSTQALVIDDDVDNLEVITRLLAAQGVTSTQAQHSRDIQSVLGGTNQVDIVFLDLEMPEMDGYEAFRLLRNNLGAEVPIVACTVHLNEVNTVRDLG